MLITENANHVGPITYEILTAQLTRRQQEHDSLVEKGKANTLFFLEVVYIFLELFLVCVALRHKCNHSIQAKGDKFKTAESLRDLMIRSKTYP